jgi:hypothetical protein
MIDRQWPHQVALPVYSCGGSNYVTMRLFCYAERLSLCLGGHSFRRDEIVQAAVVAFLTPIYEAEFLGFSYGFRPGRSQHRHFEPRLAHKVHRAPGGRSKNHLPDPEMAEGGCAGGRPAD